MDTRPMLIVAKPYGEPARTARGFGLPQRLATPLDALPGASRLGIGLLGWPRSERQTDRYGSVFLEHPGPASPWESVNTDTFNGSGTLLARVVESRTPTHEGDWARGLTARRPSPGDVFTLGKGIAWSTTTGGRTTVGLRPASGRKVDWLHPIVLYRVHGQVVELWFEPRNGRG